MKDIKNNTKRSVRMKNMKTAVTALGTTYLTITATTSNEDKKYAEGTNLSGSNFKGKNINTMNFLFIKVILDNSDFTNAVSYGEYAPIKPLADFSYSSLIKVKFVDAYLENTVFIGANLTDADFTRADLRRVNFTDAILIGVNFTNIKNLALANFTRTNLSNRDLSGLFNISFNANFTDADLSNTNLTKLNFSKAILSGANLKGANLSNTNLSNTNLSNANLSNANLTNADLTNADLTNANLSNAILTGTILTGAILTGVTLKTNYITPGVNYGKLQIFLQTFESNANSSPDLFRTRLVIFNFNEKLFSSNSYFNVYDKVKNIQLDLSAYAEYSPTRTLINLTWTSAYSSTSLQYIGLNYTFDSLDDYYKFINIFNTTRAMHITVNSDNYYSPAVNCTMTSLQTCDSQEGIFTYPILVKRTVNRNDNVVIYYEIYADTINIT